MSPWARSTVSGATPLTGVQWSYMAYKADRPPSRLSPSVHLEWVVLLILISLGLWVEPVMGYRIVLDTQQAAAIEV